MAGVGGKNGDRGLAVTWGLTVPELSKETLEFFPLRRVWVYFSCSANIHWASGMTAWNQGWSAKQDKTCPEELMLAGEADHGPGTCVRHQGAIRTQPEPIGKEGTLGGGIIAAWSAGWGHLKLDPWEQGAGAGQGRAGLAIPSLLLHSLFTEASLPWKAWPCPVRDTRPETARQSLSENFKSDTLTEQNPWVRGAEQ